VAVIIMQTRNPHSACLLFALVSLISLLFSVGPSFAGTGTPLSTNPLMILSADKQFQYAQDLFSARDYSTAAGEYKRFVYFFPKDRRVEFAMYRIGRCHFLGGHYQEAVSAFEKLTEQYFETEYSIKSYYSISEAYVKMKAFGQALIDLNNLVTITHNQDAKDEAYYRMGWIYIDIASWDEARRYFNKISAKNRHKFELEKLSAALEKETAIPRKNPKMAGFLSLVPGAGYLYCGRYQDALIAFLLNGGLIYAAYESFDQGLSALGGVISFVEFGFYSGNIYGAISSAHKYNRQKTGEFIHHLKENVKINLSADMKNKGVILSLQWSF
jgi:TolA-binding protein/TM2 domain-containing membrane protein YozV